MPNLRERIVIGLLATLLSACAGAQSSPGASASDLPRADQPEEQELACSRDIECALVDDCCGCARGGLRMGIRADKLETATERSAGVCEERPCSGQASEHRSCEATAARCLGGRCVPAL
jgi:hypothetical protein